MGISLHQQILMHEQYGHNIIVLTLCEIHTHKNNEEDIRIREIFQWVVTNFVLSHVGCYKLCNYCS